MQQEDYQALDPDTILDAIESTGLEPQSSLLALNSYENRVYQFRDYDEKKYVIKIYRPERWSREQIIEEHQFCMELTDNELPIVSPNIMMDRSLHEHSGYWFAIFENRGGRIIDLEQLDQLTWMGRFIARIHNIGANRDYKHRPAISVQRLGDDNLPVLEKCPQLPEALKSPYLSICEQVINLCRQKQSLFESLTSIRLHGDCHQGNVLWTDQGPHFVDFDDSVSGCAVQDLWMLVTGQDDAQRQQWQAVLKGYQEFRSFDYRELHVVEALRALRMIHYTAWLARRWCDPSFPHHFPWFEQAQYWESQILLLKEQFAAIEQPLEMDHFQPF